MRYEPAIDRCALSEAIRSRYGMVVNDLEFIPVGFVAACYSFADATGDRFFLKIWSDTGAARATASRRDTVLLLTRALRDRQILDRVPHPLVSLDGRLWEPLDDAAFAVFPFLPGQPPPAELTDDLRAELARDMATLHAATGDLVDVLPPKDTFGMPFADLIRRDLRDLAGIGSWQRPGLQALKAAILPRSGDITSQLARLRTLQRTVRSLPSPMVLCHTDLGGGNLLVDDGRLYLLDWDEAVVAPPEYDLKEAYDTGFSQFLEVYTASGGASPLSLDRFAFYLLRRYLEDLSARLHVILRENITEEQDTDALDGIEAYSFDRWNVLDDTLANIDIAMHDLTRVRR